MQILEQFTDLRKLVLEDISSDCIKINKIEELIIINNSSDILYIDLNKNYTLHTLVIQRSNAIQITEIKFLISLQKLVLFEVDILEKDL